jgi:hypothetical protein
MFQGPDHNAFPPFPAGGAMDRRAALLFTVALAALALAGCIRAPAPALDPGPEAPAPEPWPRNVQVTTGNGPASEVALAINPANPLNLLGGAKDYTLGSDPGPGCDTHNVWSGVYVTLDGGLTWEDFLMPGYPGDANTTLLSHYTCNSDPVVAFGSDGTAYYSGLAYGGQGQQGTQACPTDARALLCGRSIWTARSTDGGLTWGDFVNVVQADDGGPGALAPVGLAGTVLDKQWFAVDPNDPQHLVMTWIWFTAAGGGFHISESRDGARTWGPPVLLQGLEFPIHQFAMPAIGPDGTIHVVWHQFQTFGGAPLPVDTGLGAGALMFTASLAPGVLAFPPARAVLPMQAINGVPGEEFRASSHPILAVDQASGALHVVWPEQREGHSDIVHSVSTDGGATWSTPATVNTDQGSNDQFFAWVAVDEEGGVDVVFYDRAYSNNTLLDFTLARSVDQGQSWNSWRLTSESWAFPEGC